MEPVRRIEAPEVAATQAHAMVNDDGDVFYPDGPQDAAEFAAEHAARPLHTNPYDEDGYCRWCGNGRWKRHSWECAWADAQPIFPDETKAPPRTATDESKVTPVQNLRT